MKILSWNVNQGKDYRNLIDMINILNDYRSDVIFLHEFINNRYGQILRNTMDELGWTYQYFTGIGSMSGILILSRKNFSPSRCNYKKPSKSYGWLDILFDDCRISVLAVNIPHDDGYMIKDEYWERLLEYSRIKTVDDCLIISTMHPDNESPEYRYLQPISEITRTGWIDLIQEHQSKNHKERGEGSIPERFDYAFASRMAYNSVTAAYLSKYEREKGFTRSAMVVELL